MLTDEMVGPYRILGKLGEGGMGEVYRARDTALDRDVAIKILPDAFVNDAERLARFQREAKVLASLNHPNIAAIHGLEESGDSPALILEYVDGATLQDRIAQGPIPLDEALPIAKQIAEALEAAHEQGIVHRDLKPANVKVKPDGTVKVLDFGLAKALNDVRSAGASAPATDAANSPTMTMTAAATKMGVVMGTAAYMSPEQARGKPVDKRTDIWAFGVVLYEMLTGSPPFKGEDITLTLAEVVKSEPAWNALPADLPASLDIYLCLCLEKDPRQRIRDIGDVRLALAGAFETAASVTTDGTGAPVQPALWQRQVAVATMVIGAAVVTALATWGAMRPAPPPPRMVTRTSIILPRSQVRTNADRRGIAISPMGTHVVYIANGQLYLRALDQLEAQPLSSTEGSTPGLPFFSPDGQWIGFYSRRDRAIKKVALSGGAAVTLTESGGTFGASWGADDRIVFGQGLGRGILSVAGTGGTAEVVVSVEPNAIPHQPQMLPGGQAILYTLGTEGLGRWETAQIVVLRLETGERTVLVEGGTDARYLPTGHLVYALGNTLLGAPFDVQRLQVTGGPVPLVAGVSRAGVTGAANFDISQTGTLVYLPGGAAGATLRTLVWVDRDGTEEPLPTSPRGYVYPRLSPDGTQVTLDAEDDGDVWVWDVARTTMTRLTFDPGRDNYGVWTPDGRRVVYAAQPGGSAPNLYWRAADGTGAAERLVESPNNQFPNAVSPDGTRLVFYELGPNGDRDLYTLSLDDERRVEPLIVTGFNESSAEISPDGRWLSYQSDASGQDEIYVQPFPNVDDGRWQVSTAGGSKPVWGPDGQELFYLTEAGVMGVTLDTRAGFQASTPRLIVAGRYFGSEPGARVGRTYDVARDGQRFLMIKESGLANPDDPFAGLTQIQVVLNWSQELLERVPVP